MTEESVIACRGERQSAPLFAEKQEAYWLRQAQRAAAAGAWKWDLDRQALRCSHAFCTLHGLGAGEGAPSLEQWLQSLHPDERSFLSEALLCWKRRGGPIEIEYRIIRDGKVRWVRLKGCVLRNEEGEPACAVGMAMDVTTHKQQGLELLVQSDGERRRVGHALRDELGQQLTGILMKTQVLQEKLSEENSEHTGYVERIVELLDEAHTYTRELVRTLTPLVVRREELGQALSQLAANTKRIFNVACWFESDGFFTARSDEVSTHLHRVAGVAVKRAVHQAHARRITIELFAEKGQGVLRVSDDGEGKKGLCSVQRCIEAMGATLAVQPAVLGGLAVTCSFPL